MRFIRYFRKPGDLFVYMDRFSANDQHNETYHRLKELGLVTFEDLGPGLSQLFGDQRTDCTNLDDFVIGKEYTSHDIAIFSRHYNVQSGIYRIHHDENLRAVFVKATFGGEGKYANEWIEEGYRLKYFLKSRNGKFDPKYKANVAIQSDKPIYLFEKIDTACKLRGIFHFRELHKEIDGALWCELIRSDGFLHGRPATTSTYREELGTATTKSLHDSSDERRKRIAAKDRKPRKIQTVTTTYERSPDVIAEVLLRSGGNCERCDCKAPFVRRKDDTPYLEVHHIRMLADGGEDTVENAVAICPNCHRFLHYGSLGDDELAKLAAIAIY